MFAVLCTVCVVLVCFGLCVFMVFDVITLAVLFGVGVGVGVCCVGDVVISCFVLECIVLCCCVLVFCDVLMLLHLLCV